MLRSAEVPMLLVHDEYGHFEGIVTPNDLLAAIAGEFASDQEQGSAANIVALDDGSMLIDGGMSADAMAEALDIDLPETAILRLRRALSCISCAACQPKVTALSRMAGNFRSSIWTGARLTSFALFGQALRLFDFAAQRTIFLFETSDIACRQQLCLIDPIVAPDPAGKSAQL